MAGDRAHVGQRDARPGDQRHRHREEHLADDHQRVAVGQAVHRGGHRALDGVLQRHQRGVGVPRTDGGQGRGDTRLGVPGSLRGGNDGAEGRFGEGTLGPEIGEPRRRRAERRPGHPTRVVRAGGGRCLTRGKLPRCTGTIPARRAATTRGLEGCVTPRPVRRVPEVPTDDLEAVLWRLLGDGAPRRRRRPSPPPRRRRRRVRRQHRPALDRLAARRRRPPAPDRRATPTAVHPEVAAAREALEKCSPSADTALAMAYLAHVEVTADHVDAAMLLAVDASLLTESPAPGGPSRALQQAHRWLSLDALRAGPRGAGRSRTPSAGSTSPPPCATRSGCGGCGCSPPARTSSSPRRLRRGRRRPRRANWPSRRSRRATGRARPRRTSPIPATTTCSTSSRRGR